MINKLSSIFSVLIIFSTLISYTFAHDYLDEECQPWFNPTEEFDIRDSVHPSYNSLLPDIPKMLHASKERLIVNGRKITRIVLESHQLARGITKLQLIKAIADIDAYQESFVVMKETEALCSEGLLGYTMGHIYVDVGFAAIRFRLDFTLNYYHEKLEDGAYIQKFNMESEETGKVHHQLGSIYINDVIVNGQSFVYIRYYINTGFYKVPSGVDRIALIFARKDMLDTIKIHVKRAREY